MKTGPIFRDVILAKTIELEKLFNETDEISYEIIVLSRGMEDVSSDQSQSSDSLHQSGTGEGVREIPRLMIVISGTICLIIEKTQTR